MKSSPSTLALGLIAVAGFSHATMIPNSALGFTLPAKGETVARSEAARPYEKRTMIPNAELGFELPAPEAKVVERGEPARPYEKRTMIPNAELGFTLPAAGAKVEERGEPARPYEKRTMIPNSELGFTLPAAGAKVEERAEAAHPYEKRTMIPNSELGFTLPGPESKRDEVGPTYEKRTMIPNAELHFTLPSDPKLASRSAAWERRTIPEADAKVKARAAVWQPAVGASWQIVLSNSLKLTSGASVVPSKVGIYDIDLFDNTAQGTDPSRIAALKAQGKKIICYFSAGTYEPNRPDSKNFTSADLGKGLPDWPGEKWLKLSSPNVRAIMSNRIAIAAKMGCDAVDPDNVDGYDNTNGLNLQESDSIDFMKFLATQAASHNMAIGLKNAGSIVVDVLPYVQFSVNEECVANEECADFQPFIDAGKPVFHIEYPSGAGKPVTAKVLKKNCEGSDVNIAKFSTVIKKMDLNGWVEYCDATTATTAVEA